MLKSQLERWGNVQALEWLSWEMKQKDRQKIIFRYLLSTSILWNKTVSGMNVSVILFDRRHRRFQSWKKTSASLITAASVKETKRKSLWTPGSGPEARFLLFIRTRSRTSWLRCGQQQRLMNPFSVRHLCELCLPHGIYLTHTSGGGKQIHPSLLPRGHRQAVPSSIPAASQHQSGGIDSHPRGAMFTSRIL